MSVKPPPARNKKTKAVIAAAPPGREKVPVEVVNKTFQIAVWSPTKRGQLIIVYADSGMGKTTLTSMLPNPKFADFRGGSDKILHPVTGEHLQYIPNVETFEDVRAICNQVDLFEPGDSFVLDTGTNFEDHALEWTLTNIQAGEKGKHHTATRIESYGWGKGFRHLYDTMKLPLADFDALANRGVNVVINCQMQQVEVANAGGENFLCDVPKLQKAHGKSTPSVWGMYNEWADHVLKIGLNDVSAKDGKAAGGNERAIFIHGQVHFKAKSRTIPSKYPIITFNEPADDAIWKFLFDECWKEMEDIES